MTYNQFITTRGADRVRVWIKSRQRVGWSVNNRKTPTAHTEAGYLIASDDCAAAMFFEVAHPFNSDILRNAPTIARYVLPDPANAGQRVQTMTAGHISGSNKAAYRITADGIETYAQAQFVRPFPANTQFYTAGKYAPIYAYIADAQGLHFAGLFMPIKLGDGQAFTASKQSI